jgi:hypothetical protein
MFLPPKKIAKSRVEEGLKNRAKRRLKGERKAKRRGI